MHCYLLRRAHTLVDAAPDSWLSWYAVGVYYMATRAYEQARLHFARATQLNPRSAAAWLGAGHAFAEQVQTQGARACGEAEGEGLTEAEGEVMGTVR